MSKKRFICIDIGYGDDWYITDNGRRLSEMEIVNLLNKQQDKIDKLQKENIELKKLKKYFAEWIGVKEDNLSLRCGDMTEKQLNNTKEKINCKKKYLYEHSMFWECNDGCKCQILEDDVVDLLNKQQDIIQQKDNQIKQMNLAIDDLLSYVSCDEIKKQNEILRNAYLKIPKGIRDVWKE